MSDEKIERIPIADLRVEEGAHELATSADMEPYIRLAMAVMQGIDPTSRLKEIAQLPLEKRYVWRVASALKWGFADFDDLSVKADSETLPPEDFAKLADLLKFRPIQFCMFLKALVGTEEMERLLGEAIAVSKSNS